MMQYKYYNCSTDGAELSRFIRYCVFACRLDEQMRSPVIRCVHVDDIRNMAD